MRKIRTEIREYNYSFSIQKINMSNCLHRILCPKILLINKSKNMQIKTLTLFLISILGANICSMAQTPKTKLLGKTDKGVSIYSVYSRKSKTNSFYGIGDDGVHYTAKKRRPIKSGTTTSIPSDCNIDCIKSFDGKSEQCYLICPSKKKQ